MDVLYRDDDLEECANDERKGRKTFGRAVARKFISRVNFLKQARSTKDIPASWRFKPLKGTRKGEYSIDLNKGDRLIVTLPGPGQILIEEVNTDHYG